MTDPDKTENPDFSQPEETPGASASAGPTGISPNAAAEPADDARPARRPPPKFVFPPELMGPEEEPEEEPVPEVSFLSRRPPAGAFVWALLYAFACGVVTAVASWNEGVSKLMVPAADLFTWKSVLGLPISMMVHSGPDHYLGNMALLVPIAGFATAYYGFWVFPVLGITLGIATHALSLWTYPPYMHLVGSSGLLYAMFGLWLVLYAGVESHLSWRRRAFRLTGFAALMLLPHTYSPTTSYRAHAIGFFLGAAAGLVVYAFRRVEFARRNEEARQEVLQRAHRR